MPSLSTLASIVQRDLTLREISGSLGDLGTFLPLLVGLVINRGLDLGTTLILTGVYNIVSGLVFGVPMPVQPMKAIAAVALSEVALGVPEIMAAGIFVGAVVLVMGVARFLDGFQCLVPTAVIHGLQLGVGLNLAEKGVKLVWYNDDEVGIVRGLGGQESIFIGLAAAIFILVTVLPYEKLELPLILKKQQTAATSPPVLESDEEQQPNPAEDLHSNWRIPAALIIVIVGILLALGWHPSVFSSLRFGPEKPRLQWPTKQEWKTGIWRGGVAQLPLTLLNSVIAVCQLADEMFPGQGPSPTKVAVSVGLMNLFGPWLGALPCCHGAGGLASQVRFGARSGAAPIFLGTVKVLLGLCFGSSLLLLLKSFPKQLLGAMLIFSGAELAASCRHQKGQRGTALMLLTTSAIKGTGNTSIGFLAGMAATLALLTYDWSRRLESRWRLRRVLSDYTPLET